MNLREIARLCGASGMMGEAVAGLEPAGLCIDSRGVQPGDLFVAIPGAKVDGHEYVREALGRGATAAMVVHHRLPFADALHATLGEDVGRLIFVDSTICALQQLSARLLALWEQGGGGRAVVGITASAGKTTMKDLTAHLLAEKGRVLKSPGNLNTGYGLALTLSRMICRGGRPGDFDLAVIEMGMSSYGEIARLTDLANPQVGLVGNVGTAHLEFFGTQAAIARAKAEMIDGIRPGGTAILNGDDPLVSAMRERRRDINHLSFAIDSPADLRATALRGTEDLRGTIFQLETPGGRAEVMLPLIGRHNVYNSLAAAAVAHAFGLPVERIAARLATATSSRMRGEIMRFTNGVTVIDDSYNSNPAALLEAVRAMTVPGVWKRRIVVAGEMLELGAQASELHREAGREIAALDIDLIIGVRGLAADLIEGASSLAPTRSAGQAIFLPDAEEAAERLVAEARSGDLILVKGSRGVRMERIVERLRTAFAD